MKSEQLEDKRYRQSDFCQIRAEERVIFTYLQDLQRPGSQPLKLLDIGCGSGLITKKIEGLGFIVKGVDFSPVAVRKAAQRGINATVANLDEGIPEPDQSYNLILAGDIIEHTFDPIFVIKEISRVLKTPGYLLITVPNDVSIMVRLKILLGISYQEIMYRRTGFYKHHTFFSKHLLELMFTQAGLTAVKQNRVTNLGHKKQIVNPLTPLLFTNTLIVMAQKK